MLVALVSAGLASGLCATAGRVPLRSRVLHLVPVPLMAVGMGPSVLPGGLLVGLGAAGGLWVLGVVFGRRASAGRTRSWADSVDSFVMAAAVLVCTAGSSVGVGGGPPVGLHGSAHAHGSTLVVSTGLTSVSEVWITAGLMAGVVVVTRTALTWRASSGRPVPRAREMWRECAVAALMGVSTWCMVIG